MKKNECKKNVKVFVPEPQENDLHVHSFCGTIVKVEDNVVLVEDKDGDHWEVKISKLSLDETDGDFILKSLLFQTGTMMEDWDEADGMETGVGIERWYINNKTQESVYICLDQGDLSISFDE